MINLNKKHCIFLIMSLLGASCYADNQAPVVKSYCISTTHTNNNVVINTIPTNTEITWTHKSGEQSWKLYGNIDPFVNNKVGVAGDYIAVQKTIKWDFDTNAYVINTTKGWSKEDFPLYDGAYHVLVVTPPNGAIYKLDNDENKTPSSFRIVSIVQPGDYYVFNFTENNSNTECV